MATDLDSPDTLWRIVEALHPAQRDGLTLLLQDLGHADPECWVDIPSLRQTITMAAALRLRRLKLETGTAEYRATIEIAAELGLKPSTLESLFRRWKERRDAAA